MKSLYSARTGRFSYLFGRVRLLRRLSGNLRLSSAIGALLLRLVMGMRLFVVIAALATEEEQDLLRVSSAHVDRLRLCRVTVKRATICAGISRIGAS